jgi:hypothetical protein
VPLNSFYPNGGDKISEIFHCKTIKMGGMPLAIKSPTEEHCTFPAKKVPLLVESFPSILCKFNCLRSFASI